MEVTTCIIIAALTLIAGFIAGRFLKKTGGRTLTPPNSIDDVNTQSQYFRIVNSTAVPSAMHLIKVAYTNDGIVTGCHILNLSTGVSGSGIKLESLGGAGFRVANTMPAIKFCTLKADTINYANGQVSGTKISGNINPPFSLNNIATIKQTSHPDANQVVFGVVDLENINLE